MPPALPFLIVTTESVAGRETVATLGAVSGSAVWSKHVGRDVMASFKTLVGGEIRGYTEMLMEARGVATQRMVDQALSLGADAVVCTRFATAGVMQGMSEVIAFGTAVKLA